MNKSLFVWLATWFASISSKIEENVNGVAGGEPQPYLHKEMLTSELSTDLTWDSASIDGSVVAADIVAMDSPLPLKRRDSVRAASGDLPKAGMKFWLSEKQLSQIDTMKAKGVKLIEIVTKVFADTKKAVYGVYERNEINFLEALSTGTTLIDNADENGNNNGLGIRVDFGYLDSNRFNASTEWSDPNAKIVDDITKTIKHARTKGNTIRVIMMDVDTANNIAQNNQVKNNFAFAGGIATEGANVPTLDDTQLVTFFARKFKVVLKIVDRTVTTESDGKRKVHTPWASGAVVFLTSPNVGRLVYGILAEDTRRNPEVMYEKVEYILVKKWHTNEPFSEYTSSQALCLPVIDNASSICVLDSNSVNAGDQQTEGDANFDYKEESYTKASVLAGIKAAKPTSKLTIASTDAKLLETINEFSEEQIALFEAKLVASA